MTPPTFQQTLDEGECFLFDGSTATALHDRGITLQRGFEECNLKAPDLVLEIYGSSARPGAQILTTNTWAANRLKLRGGLESLLEINRKGAALAREALAGRGRAWVAGCIGPLGVRIEPWGPTSFDEARGFFASRPRRSWRRAWISSCWSPSRISTRPTRPSSPSKEAAIYPSPP